MNSHVLALALAFGTFISTLCGGLFGIRHRNKLHLIISLTAGVLIGVVFFDIIPEMFSIMQENGFAISSGMIAIVAGFFFIHIVEKIAVIHTAHEDEYADHTHPLVGSIGALGLSFHSFLDGMGIGLGFLVNAHVGLLIAIAVIAHDFCDGLNTVSVMLINKNSVQKAKYFLLLDAIMPLVGFATTFFIPIPTKILVIILGFFAGFLLYLGASDLLPEAHSKRSSYKLIGLTMTGALFIFIITRFT